MQKSVSLGSISSVKKTDTYSHHELEAPPPPYKSELEDESLPLYKESNNTSSLELESILNRFAPRLDDQRVYHHYSNSDSKHASTEQMLDRMEEYRHKDQEWSSKDQIRLMQIVKNMYHSPQNPSPSKRPSCLFSAKSKYQKITLSIAKEREHLVQQMKKIRSSPSSLPNDEFDHFLNAISTATSQSQMSNQRALRMAVATV